MFPLVTTQGDRFEVTEEYMGNFPKPDYKYEFWYCPGGNRLYVGEWHAKSPVVPSVPVKLFEDTRQRCYAFWDSQVLLIVMKGGATSAESLRVSQLGQQDPKAQPHLVDLASSMYAGGDWRWQVAFAEFLVKAGDVPAIASVRLHAKGTFDSAELDANAKSAVTKEDVTRNAKDVVVRYKL
jgi:hypothetical protein